MKKLLMAVAVLVVLWTAGAAFAGEPGELAWTRTGKVGWSDSIKIPSNAHENAVYDKTKLGIFFRWNPKQKDDCLLTVEPGVFETIESFQIVAKNANQYHIATVTEAGVYDVLRTLFEGGAKNINRIEIGNFNAVPTPPKEYRVAGVTATGAGILTDSLIGEVADAEEYDARPAVAALPGSNPSDIWVNGIKNADPALFEKMTVISMDGPEGVLFPTFVWNDEKSPSPVAGELVRFDYKFLIEGMEITDTEVPFYGAADNGFVLFVNGKYVGQSTRTVLLPYGAPGADFEAGVLLALFGEGIGDDANTLLSQYVAHREWQAIYMFDILPWLNPGAENVVTVFAYNTGDEPRVTGTTYNADNNPSGLIYAFEVHSRTE